MRPDQQTEYIVQALREAGAMYEDDARAFLAEHDAHVHAQALAANGDGTPDFFQIGHTYSDSGGYDWKFRVDTVTTHPEDGERTALGWRFFNGEWEPYAYGEDDFEIHQIVGHIDATEAGEDR